MAKLDLDWLPIFIEVYRTRSVSRAAERLGIAQATASIALGKLRRHFDDPLFSRTTRGMEPTPRAQGIYPELLEAHARIETARGIRAPFEPGTTRREFHIGMTDISEIVLLPRLVAHIQRVAPHVVLEAERTAPDSPALLESGELDLAVGFTPDLDAGFYQQALFAQDYTCLASRHHPRVQGKLTQHAFTREGHVVVLAMGTGHSIVDKVLAQKRCPRRAVLKVPSFLGVARIVSESELLAVLPRRLGEVLASQDDVQLLDVPVKLPDYRVKQHWHERFNADPGNIWLRRTLAELFSGEGPAPTSRVRDASRPEETSS